MYSLVDPLKHAPRGPSYYYKLLQTITKTLYAAEVEPIAVVAVVRPRRAVHILKRWLGAVVAHVHHPH